MIFKDTEGKLDIQGLKNNFEELQKNQTTKKLKQDYKLEVMIAFWFAIHIESEEMAQIIYKFDPIIEKVMRGLRELGEPELIE